MFYLNKSNKSNNEDLALIFYLNKSNKTTNKDLAFHNIKFWTFLYYAKGFLILLHSYFSNSVRALSDERFLAAGGQAAFAMSHERFGR